MFASCFFILLKYPRINAVASKTNRITNPTQKSDWIKKTNAKNMTSPEIERAVSSKNFTSGVFAGRVHFYRKPKRFGDLKCA